MREVVFDGGPHLRVVRRAVQRPADQRQPAQVERFLELVAEDALQLSLPPGFGKVAEVGDAKMDGPGLADHLAGDAVHRADPVRKISWRRTISASAASARERPAGSRKPMAAWKLYDFIPGDSSRKNQIACWEKKSGIG